MWETMKFTAPLLLLSAVIITIDQYGKKTYYWKIWAAATFIGCFIFAVTFMVGPAEISSSRNHSSPDTNTRSDQGTQANEPGTENQSKSADNSSPQSNQQQTSEQPGNTQQNRISGNTAQNTKQTGNLEQTAVSPLNLFLPVDEASLNTGFKEFRDNLVSAVNSKDLAFLKNHLSPNIRFSFGSSNGVDNFLNHWQLNTNPDKSQVWSELVEVLALGGSFDEKKTVFTAPYVFANFPSTIDSFENVAVIDQNVSIHSAPDPSSPVVIGLSYKILRLADNKIYKSTGETQPGWSVNWRKVETSAGDGFINEVFIRSPIDYRAQFRQEDGVWKLIFFVAGD